MKRPCRCLVSEMQGEAELAGLIRDRIETIPEEERTPETEYSLRLARCRDCKHLQRGTCALCGCYAEIRAARRRQNCPDVPGRWI